MHTSEIAFIYNDFLHVSIAHAVIHHTVMFTFQYILLDGE
jgi:hypothetical protein